MKKQNHLVDLGQLALDFDQPRRPGRRPKGGGLAGASVSAQAPLTEPPSGNTGVETASKGRDAMRAQGIA